MKQYHNIFLAPVLALLVASCTHEPNYDIRATSDDEMRIQLSLSDVSIGVPTKTGNTEPGDDAKDENKITNLKLFLYKIEDENEQAENVKLTYFKNIDMKAPDANPDVQWDSKNSRLILKEGAIVRNNNYIIIVVANWDETNGFDSNDFVVGVSSASDILSSCTLISSPVTAPFIMSGAANNNFESDRTATIELQRQIAKLRFKVKVNENFADDFPGITFGDDVTGGGELTTYNIPNSSFVLNELSEMFFPSLMESEGSRYFDYPMEPIVQKQNGSTEQTKEWTLTQYVYENMPHYFNLPSEEKIEKLTFFILRLPYKIGDGAMVYNNYYKFYIKDPNALSDMLTDYGKTQRNNLYDIIVTVNGFGSVLPDIGGVTVTTKVLPWDHVPVTDSDGTYLLVENQKKRTLRFTIADTIKLITNDIANVTASSRSNTINIKKVDNELHVSRLATDANEEFEDDIDAVIIKHKNQTIEIPINYEPCMAQRFAKGMLVTDGNGGVKIGAPNADSKTHLGFRFGLPIGVRLDAELEGAALIAYNPVGWLGNTTITSPNTDETTYYGENIDYLEHKLNAEGRAVTKDANGNEIYDGVAGDVCRIMGKDGDNHYWRIPKAQEWQDLLQEGKLITAMNGEPIETDFGWFLGPTATDPNNKPEAPVKGSTFVYNMRFAFEERDYYRTGNNGTLNVQTSSFYGTDLGPLEEAKMYYFWSSPTQKDEEGKEKIHINTIPQFSLFCSVRCIRDYKRENTGKLN